MNLHQQRFFEFSQEKHHRRLLEELPGRLEGISPPATKMEIAEIAAHSAQALAKLELGGAFAQEAALDRGILEDPQVYLMLSRMFPSAKQ